MKISQYKQKSSNRFSPLKIGFIASFALHSFLFAVFMVDFKEDSKIKTMQSKAISLSLNNINGKQAESKNNTKASPKNQNKPHAQTKTKQSFKKIKSTEENKKTPQMQSTQMQSNKQAIQAQDDLHTSQDSTLAASPNTSNDIEILGNDDALYKTILDIINQNRIYPRMAIVRKLKGNIKVEFILLSSGDVKNIKVIEGNHRFLNENAIQTIEQTARKYPKPDKNVKIKLTLVYNLI